MTAQTTARRDQHYRAKAPGKWASSCCALFVAMLVTGCAAAESTGEVVDDPSATAKPTPQPTTEPTPFGTPPAGYSFSDYRIKAPIEFCVNPDGGPPLEYPLVLLARIAVSNWHTETDRNLPITIGAACQGTPVRENDGQSVIGWEAISGSAVGLAASVIDRNRHITEGAIVLDPTSHAMTDADCVLGLLLHEVGHPLGLAHQPPGTSVMQPNLDCTPRINEADAEAVRFLYPRSGYRNKSGNMIDQLGGIRHRE